jgi:diguanylate cyclase (GGDEF)-like protein/PAS domain S-box-containing protein
VVDTDRMRRMDDGWRLDERRARALIENASDVVTVVGLDLTIAFVTDSGAKLLGYDAEQLTGTKFASLVTPADLDRLRAACGEAADGVMCRPVELRLIHRDGTLIDGETVVRYDADNCQLVLTTRDIHERKRAERQVRRKAEQQAVVAALGARALTCDDLAVLMTDACSGVAAALGADYVAVHRHVPDRDTFTLFAAVGLETARRYYAAVTEEDSQLGFTLASELPVIVRDWDAETRFKEAPFFVTHGIGSGISARIPGGGGPFGVISVQATGCKRFNYDDGVFLQAIANILAAAIARYDGDQKIRHQALHDAGTGLPNRILFEDRLTLALATAYRHERRLAVLFLDLDNFKRINDSLGHAIGDQLLVEIAARLDTSVRGADTVARLGGDEFAVILEDNKSAADAEASAKRILDAFSTPVELGGRSFPIAASVGIARATGDTSAIELVRDADVAMYMAKGEGKNRHAVLDPAMHSAIHERLELKADLLCVGSAVEQFEVYYQPIVTLDTGAIVGLEALVRWNHPTRGLLEPDKFMALAEENGAIVTIGRAVLNQACREARRWSDDFDQLLPVSVNVSARQLDTPEFVEDVREALRESGLAPDRLVLEITESELMANIERAVQSLETLKALGVRIALDDFGTGYSSLSQLARLPIDIVKVERDFSGGLGDPQTHSALVQAVMEIAHSMHLTTVAERIETHDQLHELQGLACPLGQGFLFSHPLPADAIHALLADGHSYAADTRAAESEAARKLAEQASTPRS